MQIRNAISSDLDEITRLHLQATRQLAALAPAGFGAGLQAGPAPEDVRADFEDSLGDPDYLVLVAEEAGQVCGYLRGYREGHGDDLVGAPFITLEFIGTDPAFQRRGVARRLAAHLIEQVRAEGIDSIDLLVWAANAPAIELYRSLGFAVLEHRMGLKLS